jgi:hypothetical protein
MKTSVRAAVEVMFQRRRQCLTAGQVLINLRSLSQVRRRRADAWASSVSRRGTCDREIWTKPLAFAADAVELWVLYG